MILFYNIISTDNSARIFIQKLTLWNNSIILHIFPAVLGITFARILHFGVVTTVYFGRLFNFIFYILLTYLSIKIPFGEIIINVH